MSKIRVGIDCGSTTVKIAILDENNNIIHKNYQRHNADVLKTLRNILYEVEDKYGKMEAGFCLTGSAGFKIAESIGALHVQEVIAATTAIKQDYNNVDCCIELGGEDAKIIFFDGNNVEQRMNGSCAGGTGAFIDQMAALLNTDANGVNEYAKNHEKIYPIASRCGVFAKTDVQPLLNQGARKEDISASIYAAVVNQTVAGLAQGRKINGKVCFLGGPLTFMSELRESFVRMLDLKDAFLPDNGEVFMAYGCALEVDEYISYDEMLERIDESLVNQTFSNKKVLPRLFKSKEEIKEFEDRHANNSVEYVDMKSYKGKAYLGIDAGSTTSKMVLITEDNKILHEFYSSNKGQPLDIIHKELESILKKLPKDITIAGSCSTGYGEMLMKNAFNLDAGEIETMCHYKAAAHFMPNVDFIVDIGGQDMKCFRVQNGVITSLILNEACSSGCGSFIQTFAEALNFEVKEFATIGYEAQNPVDLGSKCTVFMNSGVKQAQKEGATPNDISAGLAISVVKNALYKVMRVNNLTEEYGSNIVVQGGTFYNNQVLRAFEQETGANVVRPSISGLMGAFGAALIAKEMELDESTIDIADFSYKAQMVTCKKCPNFCSMTVNTFANGSKFISGNRCEKGAGVKLSNEGIPNLYEYKYDKLMAYKPSTSKQYNKQTIGIPVVLNMYENIPFWFTFFDELGYKVKYSDRSSHELYQLGQDSIPSDTACYPAKMVHGHIESLINNGANWIFYPNMPINFREKAHPTKNFNCPVVACYPEAIVANMETLNENKYLMPYVALNEKKPFIKAMLETVSKLGKHSKGEISKAYDKAMNEYEAFREDVKKQGEAAVKWAKDNNKHVIVLAGRPYHIDPEINHGMDKLLRTLDCVVVSEDAISHLADHVDGKVLNQWSYHARLYDSAKWVAANDNVDMIQLVSFGCGLDAITTDEVQKILETSGKFYTQIKIDEINNLGAATIRIRSLLSNVQKK